MAPRTASRSRNHRPNKGDKKKKEEKVLPTTLDIVVKLQGGDEVILKGISTDRVLDVRKLLAVNVETCHLTNFSLLHEVRGSRLSDSQEIVSLRPCFLTLVEEDYTEELAVAHVRRLLDLIACTKHFGPSGRPDVLNGDQPLSCKKENAEPDASTESVQAGDKRRLYPPSRLAKFYDFFSFSDLKAPVQSVKRAPCRSGNESDFFSLEIRIANGKLLAVTACKTGFYTALKQQMKGHSLVDLLRHASKSFKDAYQALMKAFADRNKFANLPYGLRANTWVVPPIVAESPSTFPSLPSEDENWDGNGGGQGRVVDSVQKPWARLFSAVARMPCKTPEERELRDHKAFILHNYFADVAITEAVSAIRELGDIVRENGHGQNVKHRGTLKIKVALDATSPSNYKSWKIEGVSTTQTSSELAERNLLKGITADESAVIHDTATLGVVVVRHQGFTVVVEAMCSSDDTELAGNELDELQQTNGGANSLNTNSLRTLLHRKPLKGAEDVPETKRAEGLIRKVIEEALSGLEQLKRPGSDFIRWELGACWVQYLAESDGKNDKASAEAVEASESQTSSDEIDSPLTGRVSEASLQRLKQAGRNLHLKSIPELCREAHEYYNNVAIPKLVSDFAALELSPVEGRTLTDFMHLRGLQLSSLGRLADLCSKLPHIRSLCIHEMIIRAFKHLLRALVASVNDASDLAAVIANGLNAVFGSLLSERNKQCNSLEALVWKWLQAFVLTRFGWKLTQDTTLQLRKYAMLRGICYKVGIEMLTRDYDFNSCFKKTDIVSMVPVCKHAICSSADGRTLLESSKAALDKGKLEDAVAYGCKALTKLIAVCGPYHRMTAGAYSLLAVVLYHTGDFNQAMIYQQKALEINERELGLDHPDTMKSYGDLAVFYYRLQHTELALRYVNRALYLLHLICGPFHPNTAATYINVAMMEEALGNGQVALRYLHEALKCNEQLLGKDHIQTAASYHAIAIALSLMEAYTLSVHHEQTTLQILQSKLGPDDIRTQDAAAWLEYFDSKAVEQQEAARRGAPKPDSSIASKGHLSVSDLLDFINAEAAANEKENKRPRRPSKKESLNLAKSSEERPPQEPDFMLGTTEDVPVRDVRAGTDAASLSVTGDLQNDNEGWREAGTRRKQSSGKRFAAMRNAGQRQDRLRAIAKVPSTEVPRKESMELPALATIQLMTAPSPAATAPDVPTTSNTSARSYKEAAMMPSSRPSPQRELTALADTSAQLQPKQPKTSPETSSSPSPVSSSLSASARPFSPSSRKPVALTPLRTDGKQQQQRHTSSSPPSPGLTTVAVTPARKQVEQAEQAFSTDSQAEFVPGRNWHAAQKSVEEEAEGGPTSERAEDLESAVVNGHNPGVDPAGKEQLGDAILPQDVAAGCPDEPAANLVSSSECYSSTDTERSTTEDDGFLSVRRGNQQRRAGNASRWQQRPDGAITRVYRLQGDNSSINPQLRTTASFSPDDAAAGSRPSSRRILVS